MGLGIVRVKGVLLLRDVCSDPFLVGDYNVLPNSLDIAHVLSFCCIYLFQLVR